MEVKMNLLEALKRGLLNSHKGHYDLQMFAEDDGKPEEKGKEDDQKEKKGNDKKYTDKDVDDIVNRKIAEWKKQEQKKVDEAKRLAEMNAQQKAEYERDQLQKELNDYKKKDALSEMTKEARKMCSDKGITVSDDILSILVSDDADKTKSAVDSFANLFQKAVDEAVKEKLKGKTPIKKGTSTMTKEEILKVQDRTERQKLIRENMNLFK
jgi:hypothetical protein